jgi:hypothetical protein
MATRCATRMVAAGMGSEGVPRMRVLTYEIGFFLSAVAAAGALHELLAWALG